MRKEAVFILTILFLLPSVSAVQNVQHTLDGNQLTLTYDGTPPFLINIRGDQNIGQNGGYVWARTDANTFTIDLSFVQQPPATYYYGIKDTADWSKYSVIPERVWDPDTGLLMEPRVLEVINQVRTEAQMCDNCQVPQPVVTLDSGDKEAIFSLYLNNKKVRKFQLPLQVQQSIAITDSKGVVDNRNSAMLFVDGTNTIKFRISAKGNYFQNDYGYLDPDHPLELKYKIMRLTTKSGIIYRFGLEGDNVNSVITNPEEVAEKQSQLFGLTQTNPYFFISIPSILGVLLGAEGNLYWSNNVFTVNHGGERSIFAHEYVHGLQDTLKLWDKYNSAGFLEGMADAAAIYNGFRTWEEVLGIAGDIAPGCTHLNNPQVVHTLGRCIFKHVAQRGHLTPDFFKRLANPPRSFDLSKCTIDLQDNQCARELNALLAYATDQDMTTFVRTELNAPI